MKDQSSLPTVYLDTSVLCALHYKAGTVHGLHQATATREWWDNERKYFRLYTSAVAERELYQGSYLGQEAAIAEARRLVYLPVTKEVDERALGYRDSGLIPRNKEADALQLALANMYEVDYLMTWNYAHLANPQVQARLQESNRRQGLWTPWLVSPETIPKVALGQPVRRRD